MGHEAWSNGSRYDIFFEPSALHTRLQCPAPARYTPYYSARLDLPVSDSTRAQRGGWQVGHEAAVYELAEKPKLDLDPIELQMRNELAQDQDKNVPFSSRNLVTCMTDGSACFNWSQRGAMPAQKRQGRELVGMGMMAAIRSKVMMLSKCDVALIREGVLTV